MLPMSNKHVELKLRRQAAWQRREKQSFPAMDQTAGICGFLSPTVSAATQLNSGTLGMSGQPKSEHGCILIKLFYKHSAQDLIPWFANLWNTGKNKVFVRRPWLDVWHGVGTHAIV